LSVCLVKKLKFSTITGLLTKFGIRSESMAGYHIRNTQTKRRSYASLCG